MARLHRLCFLASLALPSLLAGCGVGTITTETGGSIAMSGHVHGGVQPITGATIQLFATGTNGNGSQALSLLTNPVVTDSHSDFSLTGDYTCPSANSQVYLVARGGNPGYPGNASNPALVLLSALGDCGNLNANAFISIDEVSTVAAVYALAPFMTAYDHVGSSATNTTGIANAFLDAHLLADNSTGMAPQLPSNLTIEEGKLYALADAIVPCVNSTGGSACTSLFTAATPSGGTAPTDVLGALLNIVKSPGSNVGAIFNIVGSTPPYPTTLTQAPNDWTMSLTVTGGGLDEPTALALDAGGNVWVTNFGDPGPAGLVAFTPQGTPFPGSPFGVGLQTDSYGLTIDKNGDVWTISQTNMGSGNNVGSVAKFHGASSGTPGAEIGQYYDGSLSFPESIASDPSGAGTILIGNYVGGTVTFYNLDGTFRTNLGSRQAAFPVSVVSDGAGGAWAGDQGDDNIVHIFANNTVQKVACCNDAQTVALDPEGNVWVTNFDPVGHTPAYTFSEVTAAGTVAIDEKSGAGLYSPGGGAVDAGGQFWVANYYGSGGGKYGTISEIAGNNTSVPAGTALTPVTGLGKDAQMSLAYTLAPDASGNIWVAVRNSTSQGVYSLRMFFGLATPTATPATPVPQAP